MAPTWPPVFDAAREYQAFEGEWLGSLVGIFLIGAVVVLCYLLRRKDIKDNCHGFLTVIFPNLITKSIYMKKTDGDRHLVEFASGDDKSEEQMKPREAYLIGDKEFHEDMSFCCWKIPPDSTILNPRILPRTQVRNSVHGCV